MVNQSLVEAVCEILAPGGTASVKTDDRILFDEMDALLSMRLDSVGLPDAQQAGGAVMSEWEEDCRRKSVAVYSREYRLGMVDPATKSPSHEGSRSLYFHSRALRKADSPRRSQRRRKFSILTARTEIAR